MTLSLPFPRPWAAWVGQAPPFALRVGLAALPYALALIWEMPQPLLLVTQLGALYALHRCHVAGRLSLGAVLLWITFCSVAWTWWLACSELPWLGWLGCVGALWSAFLGQGALYWWCLRWLPQGLSGCYAHAALFTGLEALRSTISGEIGCSNALLGVAGAQELYAVVGGSGVVYCLCALSFTAAAGRWIAMLATAIAASVACLLHHLATPVLEGAPVTLCALQTGVWKDGLPVPHPQLQALRELLHTVPSTPPGHPHMLVLPEGLGVFTFQHSPLEGWLAPWSRQLSATILASGSSRNQHGEPAIVITEDRGSGPRRVQEKLRPIPWLEVEGRRALERFRPYTVPAVWEVNQLIYTPLVCHDVWFSSLTRAAVARGAQLFILSTSCAFAGSRGLPTLLMQQVRQRCREVGRSLLVSGQTGPTALVGPRGELWQKLPVGDERALLTDSRPLSWRNTWYGAGWGAPMLHAFLWISVLLGCFQRLLQERRGSVEEASSPH